MPLPAHEQRILTEIEDQLARQDPVFAGLFHSGTRPRDDRARGALWSALAIGLTLWAIVVAALQACGAGFAEAGPIALVVVMLVGVQVALRLTHRGR